MAALDLFYSDEDRHRVVLLEEALASTGVGVVLHTSPFEPASDPVLGVLSEHVEDWMIEQAQRSSGRLIWLRLDHSEMPVAARQALALQNWPGRSADLAIAALAQSLRTTQADIRAATAVSSRSDRVVAGSPAGSARRDATQVGTSRIESGPRPWVVFAWIVGLLVVFAGLLNMTPQPRESPVRESELELPADLSGSSARAASSAVGEPVTIDSRAVAAGNSGVVAVEPTSFRDSAREPIITNALARSTDVSALTPLGPLDEIEQRVIDSDQHHASDASLCLVLAATDRESALQVLLTLSGWDRLLCRVALGEADQRAWVADSLSRLCLAPSDTALADWLAALRARHMRSTPPPCLVSA